MMGDRILRKNTTIYEYVVDIVVKVTSEGRLTHSKVSNIGKTVFSRLQQATTLTLSRLMSWALKDSFVVL